MHWELVIHIAHNHRLCIEIDRLRAEICRECCAAEQARSKTQQVCSEAGQAHSYACCNKGSSAGGAQGAGGEAVLEALAVGEARHKEDQRQSKAIV